MSNKAKPTPANNMRRFWIDQIPQAGKVANLDAEESQHIAKVLRLGAGDEIQVWDGNSSARAQIDSIQKGVVWIEVLELLPEPNLALPQIHVYLPLIKAERFEWALEKLTEVGADVVTPFHSEYSQVTLKVAAAKQGRWQRIVKEASKQCQRPRLMVLKPAVSFVSFVSTAEAPIAKSTNPTTTQRFICTVPDREAEAVKVLKGVELIQQLREKKEAGKQAAHVELLVGPEGGFTPAEIKAAVSAGYTPIGLGPNILRAETAAVVSTSLFQILK